MSFRSVSNELQRKAKVELNEVPDRIPEDITHIREWLSKEPHLVNIKADDQLLLNFLRGCKFSLQKTKEKLDMFYTMKFLLPEFYSNRDPLLPEIQEILKLGVCLPLPKTEEAGPRIVLVRCDPADPEKVPFVNIMKVCIMIIDILLHEDDNFIISGQHGFLDYKGMSVNHVLYLNVNVCKKAAICLERAYPTRPKGFHCLNVPNFIETFLNVIRPLLSEKIRKRIFVYTENNTNDVYKAVPSSLLPKEYGGSGDSIEKLTDYWKNKVEDHRNWFLEDQKYCSDETKRTGTPKTSADLFGVEGSFRKLAVD